MASRILEISLTWPQGLGRIVPLMIISWNDGKKVVKYETCKADKMDGSLSLVGYIKITDPIHKESTLLFQIKDKGRWFSKSFKIGEVKVAVKDIEEGENQTYTLPVVLKPAEKKYVVDLSCRFTEDEMIAETLEAGPVKNTINGNDKGGRLLDVVFKVTSSVKNLVVVGANMVELFACGGEA